MSKEYEEAINVMNGREKEFYDQFTKTDDSGREYFKFNVDGIECDDDEEFDDDEIVLYPSDAKRLFATMFGKFMEQFPEKLLEAMTVIYRQGNLMCQMQNTLASALGVIRAHSIIASALLAYNTQFDYSISAEMNGCEDVTEEEIEDVIELVRTYIEWSLGNWELKPKMKDQEALDMIYGSKASAYFTIALSALLEMRKAITETAEKKRAKND